MESVEGSRSLEAFHRKCVFPAVLRFRGEYAMYDMLEDLRRVEQASTEALRERQLRKLAAVLDYAAEQSAFYAGQLGTPEGEVLARLRSAPILSKEQLQTEFEDLVVSPLPRRVHRKTTGGSTGQPVTVLKDARAIAADRAATWLAYGWYGLRPGDRGARFWGSPRAMGSRRLKFTLADIAMNRIRLSAFGVTDERLEAYWNRCRTFRPRYLYGYVSMLERFARFLVDRNLDGRDLGLTCVIATSETLAANQRDLLVSVFDAPIQNEYGCGEVGPMAYACERGNLHVMSENVFVELLDEDGNEVRAGGEGTVVVTDLNNRAMPLVRYCLEDRAVRGDDCPCGRGFPVLGSVSGRKYDFVDTPDGRSFHGEYFMYLFEDLRDSGLPIDCFRIVQPSRSSLDVEVQAPGNSAGAIRESVERKLSRTLEMKVSVHVVEEIQLSDSGKLRVIENRVHQGGDL